MKEKELLKRVKILLECSYYEEQSLLGKKALSIIEEIETVLNSESETKMTWYQKGYDQGFSDANK
jgi:flagellin-specific chaperone FliS